METQEITDSNHIHLALDEVNWNPEQNFKPKKTRLYVDFGGVENDFLISRKVFLKAVRDSGVLDDALMNLGYEGAKYKFSQNAGCAMCPCSPGFIVDGVFDSAIWVTFNMTVDTQ